MRAPLGREHVDSSERCLWLLTVLIVVPCHWQLSAPLWHIRCQCRASSTRAPLHLADRLMVVVRLHSIRVIPPATRSAAVRPATPLRVVVPPMASMVGGNVFGEWLCAGTTPLQSAEQPIEMAACVIGTHRSPIDSHSQPLATALPLSN